MADVKLPLDTDFSYQFTNKLLRLRNYKRVHMLFYQGDDYFSYLEEQEDYYMQADFEQEFLEDQECLYSNWTGRSDGYEIYMVNCNDGRLVIRVRYPFEDHIFYLDGSLVKYVKNVIWCGIESLPEQRRLLD